MGKIDVFKLKYSLKFHKLSTSCSNISNFKDINVIKLDKKMLNVDEIIITVI